MHQRWVLLYLRLCMCLSSVEPLGSTFKARHLCSYSHCYGIPSDSLVFGLWPLMMERLPKPKTKDPRPHLVQRLLPWLPLSLAKSTCLQCLNHPQGLFSRSADIEVVYHLVTKHAFRIDHKQST